jgi:pimeloyl-ACP methyl ester carboxylesterase
MSDCSFQYSPTVKINCRTLDGRLPAFVFVHGFGTSIETWHDIQPLISEHAAVYMLDLKGFGLSSKPADDAYSPINQADIVTSFVGQSKLSDYLLVGHSYGGGIAVLAYKKLHDLGIPPKALVLIDPALYEQELPFFVSALRRPLLNRLTLNITSASFRARYTLRRVFFNQSAITDDRVERYARFLDLPGAHASFIKAAQTIDDTDPKLIGDSLRSIDVPTLIIWGSEDPVIPLGNAQRLKRDIASAQLVVIPKAGHVPHEECPDITAEAITKFYRQLR